MKDLLIIFIVLLILLLLISSFGGSIKYNDIHKPVPLSSATKEEKEKFITDIPGLNQITPGKMFNNVAMKVSSESNMNDKKRVTFSENLESFSLGKVGSKYLGRTTSEESRYVENYEDMDNQESDPYARKSDPYAREYAQESDPYAMESDPYAQESDNVEMMYNGNHKNHKSHNTKETFENDKSIIPFDTLSQEFASF